MRKILYPVLILAVSIAAAWYFLPDSKIDYNTQVKPILNKKCISCHGGVKREADFSLLFRQEALAKAESGKYAIIPGDAAHSELVKRITATDPQERMPYKKEPLTKEEIDILTQWIEEGAAWGDHWAYVAVKEQTVPSKNDWTQNDIDAFILDQLKVQNLKPSPQADKATLLRRVSLDLIGMPAPEPIANRYMQDQSNEAYKKLVDDLLASNHFGERWASMWLDLARYADTKGYERDDSRVIWRYRDWVINAFNADMPYNRFVTEQLAGDLLENPTDEQYIATAFHRNTMTNDEGGTDNEEFRTAAVLDRVNTTWEALMGTTFACVQCHSHPYDPFRHEEYYRFMAFFNNTRDEDTEAEYPLLRHFEKEDAEKLTTLTNWINRNISTEKAKEVYRFAKTWQPSINSIQADEFINSELTDTKWLIFRNHAQCRLPNVTLTGSNRLIYRYSSWVNDGVWKIHLDRPDGPVLKTISVKDTKNQWQIVDFTFTPVAGAHDLYFTYTNPNLKNPDDSGMIFDWFYFTDSWDESHPQISKTFWELVRKEPPTTPIMFDNPEKMKRPTHIFERGNWLVKGDAVEPGVPHTLVTLANDAPLNRLGMAQWMTDPAHPLTARTIVNRMWEQIFGIGLAETVEDLGTQGIPPTHPQLLDHLSWKLVHEYDWSLKKLVREIVLSATYQQSSDVSEDLLEKDPLNKFYARAPRVRLSAEQLRDQALAVSGLLSTKMYGPSVMPYQPAGIWKSPWNGQDWKKSEGEDQHRRSLYTYLKRTAPYPSMLTFDGASREVCTARRIRTNTPLQALVTLNDSVYVEAAHHLALKMQTQTSVREQVAFGYETATGQKINERKLAALEKLYQQGMKEYKGGNMVMVRNRKEEQPQLKALSLVAAAILNLDEVVTKN
ncbi:MAG: DUF1553 domain-containing protein [Cyclobacteriaceae bacterium]|nr:DUF1553 domain-containing protein [Cyclobacteriaceae bacterium]